MILLLPDIMLNFPFVSSEVETRQRRAKRLSTSLGTNGEGVRL
ncbi:hypothetical protein [Sphingopyxis solisilvae]|nr:hypothetical protein [Sphingopyxis solisilvae]